MISHRAGQQVVICEGCYKVITESPEEADAEVRHMEVIKSATDTDPTKGFSPLAKPQEVTVWHHWCDQRCFQLWQDKQPSRRRCKQCGVLLATGEPTCLNQHPQSSEV